MAMRLKKTKVAAEEELIHLMNEGYCVLSWIRSDYNVKSKDGTFDSGRDNQIYEDAVNKWGNKVIDALNSIFPTKLESNSFLNPLQS